MLSIGQLITAGLLKFVWVIFLQGPLALINYAHYAIYYVTNGIIWNVFFDTNGVYKDGTINPPNFDDLKVPWVFLGFIIIAIFVGLILFVWQIARVIAFKNKDYPIFKQGIINAVKYFFFGLIVMALIPALFFFLAAILGWMSEAITLAFEANGNNLSLADQLYLLGAPAGFNSVPSNFVAPDDSIILQYNFFIEIIGTWFALFAFLLVSWIILLKIAELFFLYLLSPIASMAMMIDDGKRMNLWKSMVISKVLVILGNLCMFYVYVVLLEAIHTGLDNTTWFSTNGGNISKEIVELAAIVGSSMAVFASSGMMASFVGESFGLQESMGMIAGFMGATGAGLLAGSALRGAGSLVKSGGRGILRSNLFKKTINGGRTKERWRQKKKIDEAYASGHINKPQADLLHQSNTYGSWRKRKALRNMASTFGQTHSRTGFKSNDDIKQADLSKRKWYKPIKQEMKDRKKEDRKNRKEDKKNRKNDKNNGNKE